jgi:superfamily II DNA/RNA helicase
LTYLVIDEFDTLIDSSADIEPLCSKSLKANININLVSATYTNKMKQFISQVLPDLPIIQEKRAHMHLENLKHEFIHVININKLPSL